MTDTTITTADPLPPVDKPARHSVRCECCRRYRAADGSPVQSRDGDVATHASEAEAREAAHAHGWLPCLVFDPRDYHVDCVHGWTHEWILCAGCRVRASAYPTYADCIAAEMGELCEPLEETT